MMRMRRELNQKPSLLSASSSKMLVGNCSGIEWFYHSYLTLISFLVCFVFLLLAGVEKSNYTLSKHTHILPTRGRSESIWLRDSNFRRIVVVSFFLFLVFCLCTVGESKRDVQSHLCFFFSVLVGGCVMMVCLLLGWITRGGFLLLGSLFCVFFSLFYPLVVFLSLFSYSSSVSSCHS